jgi:hypothetical protein
MALHLNLLHEEIQQQRDRQRDPLKIGMMVLGVIGALLALIYLWNLYRMVETKRRFAVVDREWTKIEPDVTAAKRRAAELNDIIKTTRVLDESIENRFFWGPFLQKIALCVAPNAQLKSVQAGQSEDGKHIEVTIDGIAAGREPRAAAEDLRQMLLEQLGKSYGEVKIEFKTLEDLDTMINMSGANMSMSHYILTISFNPKLSAKPATAPATPRNSRK